MLSITPESVIHFAITPVDFRKGINGLAALCKPLFATSSFSGHIFLFRNKRQTSVKLLAYDNNGFWLCQKRFSQGRIKGWPRHDTDAAAFTREALQRLLQQLEPFGDDSLVDWRVT